jgi:translation initiation factor IF-3
LPLTVTVVLPPTGELFLIGRRRSRLPLPLPENTNRARVNEKIRVPNVRLIDETGQQVGIVSAQEALQRAQQAGLDLVEVSAESKPPVCRIQDYSKYLFEQQKKDRAAKANAHKSDTKEVRLRPGTGQGDLDIKAKHAREFLADGHKVSLLLQFRGREMSHRELGIEMIKKFAAQLSDVARIEQEPRSEGKRMFALLTAINK